MRKLYVSIIMLIIASVVSCTRDNIEIIQDHDHDLSVSAVKAWFKKPSTTSSDARIANNRFAGIEPEWGLAKQEITKAGNTCLEVPLKYSNDTRWMSNLGTNGKEELQINTPNLWMVV